MINRLQGKHEWPLYFQKAQLPMLFESIKSKNAAQVRAAFVYFIAFLMSTARGQRGASSERYRFRLRSQPPMPTRPEPSRIMEAGSGVGGGGGGLQPVQVPG